MVTQIISFEQSTHDPIEVAAVPQAMTMTTIQMNVFRIPTRLIQEKEAGVAEVILPQQVRLEEEKGGE